MVRASVTERWAQLQTGNNILVSQVMWNKKKCKIWLFLTFDYNIRDRQPMVRASITERWDQLQTGNNILVSQTFYTKIIV